MKKDGKKRVWFLLIFCTAVFAAFLVRLYWMQFTMADHYAKKLEQASQTSYTVRIPAARGSIVDRSGTALVQDDTVYDLALCVPAPPDTEMAQTTLALTLILSLLNAFKVFREAYLVSGRYPQQSIYLLQHLFNNWFLSLDLPRLAAAAVLVALVLLVVILGLLKWWDHCAKDE